MPASSSELPAGERGRSTEAGASGYLSKALRAKEVVDAREEVLAFITQLLSNQRIAETAYLSLNSVSWGMQHGLAPAAMRHYDQAEGDIATRNAERRQQY